MHPDRDQQAEAVVRALEHERRRQVAARDAAILAGAGDDDDMGGLADYVSGLPIDVD